MAIKVNLSEDDFKQATEGFTPLPKGTYDVEIAEVTAAESKSAKNAGKPLYRMVYKVVNNPDYNGRKLFHTICLWEGAHYSLVQLLKALDLLDGPSMEVPEPEELLGKEIKVTVSVEPPNDHNDEEHNEVKRIVSDRKGTTTSKGGRGTTKKRVNFDD